jgi:hypothetical protein
LNQEPQPPAEDISGKCVCKRSLTADGKCPTCSHKPDDCNCDQDAVLSDNATELQAMASGSGEMGGRPPSGMKENKMMDH